MREAQERHAGELRLLQDRHQQHLMSLSAELQARHQADTAELRAALERQHWALAGAQAAELQMACAAEVRALEVRCQSGLEATEAHPLSEVEALCGEHRRALELLSHQAPEQASLTSGLEGFEWEHDAELRSAEGHGGAEPGTKCPESPRVPAARPGRAQQVRRALPLPAQGSSISASVLHAVCVRGCAPDKCQCVPPACACAATIGGDFGRRPVRFKDLCDCRPLGRLWAPDCSRMCT